MTDDKKFSAKEFEEYYDTRNKGEQTVIDQMLEQFDVQKKISNLYGEIQSKLQKEKKDHADISKLISEQETKYSENLRYLSDLREQHQSLTAEYQKSMDRLAEINKLGLDRTVELQKEAAAIENITKLEESRTKNNAAIDINQKAIIDNLEKQKGMADKLKQVEEEMAEVQLRSIHDGMDLTDEYNKLTSKREFFQKRINALLNDGNKYQEDAVRLEARRDNIFKNLQNYKELQKIAQQNLETIAEKEAIEERLPLIMGQMQINEEKTVSLKRENLQLENSLSKLAAKRAEIEQRIAKLNTLFLMAQLVKMAFDRFVQLDAAAEKFRRETGFSVTQMEQLRKNAEAINVQFADMGVSIEKVYDSAKALADVFGRTTLITQEALKNVALLSANLNVAEADSAGVLATFQGLGNATEEAAMNVIKVGAGISEKAGIPFSLVMKDIASASEQTTTMLGANPSKLMKAAIAARSLGVDMNKLVSSQRKLLDFSSSINDELEVSALLGKSVSFQKARQLAYEGDIEGAAKATLETVKAAGNFDKMNVYQREALAKASGMELKDLTKMMAIEKQRSEIMASGDTERINKLLAQEEELKKLKNINDLNDKDLVNQNEKALLQEKMQGVMTRLKNTMDSLVVAFADILEPIITPLITLLVPGMKILAGLVKIIIYPFKALSNIFVDLGKQTEEISSNWQWIKSASDAISNLTQKIKDFYKENEKVIDRVLGIAAGGGLFAMMFAGSKGLGGVSKMITSPLASFKGGLAKIPGIGGMFGGGKSPIDGVEKVGKSAKSGGLGEGLGKMISGFMEYVANGIGYFGNSKVLKGAVGIALVGASIIPFAYAMTLFSNVDWKSVGIGALALAGFTAAAFGLGLLLSSGVGAAIFGTGVIGIAALGVALIPFSVAALAAGAGVKMLGEGISSSVDPIMKLSEIDLTTTALGITAVAAALAAFGGGSAASGLGSFVGSLLGGDPIKKMQALAEVGDKLKITADAISQISVATSQFGAVDSFSGAISKLAESLTTLNNSIRGFNFEGLKTIFQTSIGENTATTTAQSPATFATSGVEAKLDELINLLKDGAIGINIDGIKASKVLARAST